MKAQKPIIGIFLLFCSLLAAHAATVDGIISEGEYSRQASFDKDNFKLYWQVEGAKVFFAIDAAAPGWVAIGFDPGTVMSSCDMVFGIVKEDGSVQAIDAWSSGIFGPHPADVDQGGKNDILVYAGARRGNRVIFEFSRLLDTGDSRDKVLPAEGPLRIIWAYATNVSFTAKHARAGSATISLGGNK